MFDLQTLLAAIVIGGAFVYAALVLVRKSRAFSTKSTCADDCGCSSKSKTSKAIH
jgi:hypothetical protein